MFAFGQAICLETEQARSNMKNASPAELLVDLLEVEPCKPVLGNGESTARFGDCL
jgi:hypothetical protein